LPILSKGYRAGEFSSFVYLEILIKQFSIYLFFLGILGFFKLYFENLKIFAFLFFLFLCSGPLPIIIIFPDNIPQVQERFSLPAYLIYSIFIGFGIKAILEFLQKNIKLNYKYLSPILFFSFIPLFLNFKEVDKSRYFFPKYYIEDIFLTLPKNSIFLAKGIDTVFPFWYFNFVEKKRNDINIVYIDALTQKWYVENLRKNTNLIIDNLEKKIKSESERRTLYIENIIKNNIDKQPIYYGGASLFIPEGIKRGTVIPEGILFKIIKTQRDILTDEEIKRNEELLNLYKFTKSLKNIDYPAKDILSVYAGGHFKLAINYLSKNKNYEALKELNKAIKIDKKFTPSYSTLSQIYLQKNDVRTAEKILKIGIKNNPKNIDLIFTLSYLYFNIGNLKDSIHLLDKIIKLKPDFVPAYLAKVEIYLTENNKEQAKEVLKEILKIEPDNKTAINILKQLE
jgi:tetratricopeptide (TPR) repeat protein